MIEPYIWSGHFNIRFQVLSQWVDRFALPKQAEALFKSSTPHLKHDGLEVVIGNQSLEFDEANFFSAS